jgi:hypothetical protein
MLTLIEKILFAIAVIASLYVTYITFSRMLKIVLRGQGRLDLDALPQRLITGLMALASQGRIIRHRPLTSLFHYFIAWGFIFYILVNFGDVLEGYLAGFRFLGHGVPGGLYRLVADIFSVAVLVGMIFFLLRRFIAKAPALTYHANVTWVFGFWARPFWWPWKVAISGSPLPVWSRTCGVGWRRRPNRLAGTPVGGSPWV